MLYLLRLSSECKGTGGKLALRGAECALLLGNGFTKEAGVEGGRLACELLDEEEEEDDEIEEGTYVAWIGVEADA